jgi:hypothetical protein
MLIFYFISVIVSLALYDGAFQASTLTSARAVFQIKNRGPTKYTPLRWKKEWLKRPIFRSCDSPASEDRLDKLRNETSLLLSGTPSDDSALEDGQFRPLPYHKLRDNMGQQSLDAGEEKPLQPKDFCRGAANTANSMFLHCLRGCSYSNSRQATPPTLYAIR